MDFKHLSIWILDSGALDHVCPHIKYFSNIKIIHPVPIYFTNGNTITTNFFSTIHLGQYLQLHDVLCLLKFNFSLISISKLWKNSTYQISFSHNSCHIQDVST